MCDDLSMTSQPCEALHEIQEGRLTMSDFMPPRVYASGLFGRFHATVADLRKHRFECDTCAALDQVWEQLGRWDDKRFGLLRRFIDASLEELGESVDEVAWLAAAYHDEDIFWNEIESEINKPYADLIRSHVLAGSLLENWLGSYVPSALCGFTTEAEHRHLQLKQGFDMNQTGIHFSDALCELCAGKDISVVRTVVMAGLLWRAFGGYMTEKLLRVGTDDFYFEVASKDTTDSISWLEVWRAYSALAESEAHRIFSTAITQPPSNDGHLTNDLLSGQTAMMDLLLDLEKGSQKMMEMLSETASVLRATSEVKDRCIASIRSALGPLYDRLAEPAQRFLLVAEYSYQQFAPDLEFSGVVVNFTKAFEFQLKLVFKPLWGKFQETIAGDPKMPKKNFDRLTLGELAHILRAKRDDLEDVVEGEGLSYQKMLKAIENVNAHCGAKHTAEKNMADATTFRSLFIGADSVMRALFPQNG